MKIKKSFIVIPILIVLVLWYVEVKLFQPSGNEAAAKSLYYCPMHPTFTSDKPGQCAICGMSLVKREQPDQPQTEQKQADKKTSGGKGKILYYRAPMNPSITSPVPKKDEMGMDYVPVWDEGQETQRPAGSVQINPQKQQLIGVKTEKIEKRRLAGPILTVGIVAYDPDLFIAQQEYLQALQTRKTMESSTLKYTEEQLSPVVNAAKRKLLLLGMSETEITELEKTGKPQQYLYLPENGKVWVYITIYEYEMDLVKENQAVQIEAIAYPGKIFSGKVIAVAPIIEKTVRTLKVRALIDDPNGMLKPQMYVNSKIIYDLGEKLAVPNDAILNSGTKKIVFLAEPNGFFEPREVILGPKAGIYYEVIRGLSESETVVISGNFLVDSESKLNTVLDQMTEPNKTPAPAGHTGH